MFSIGIVSLAVPRVSGEDTFYLFWPSVFFSGFLLLNAFITSVYFLLLNACITSVFWGKNVLLVMPTMRALRALQYLGFRGVFIIYFSFSFFRFFYY